jgi:hypothetical protein
MGFPANDVPGWRVGVPLAILVAFAFLHPHEEDALLPYSPLLGIAGTVLFVRLARWEGVSADLWSGLAVAVYFLPALTLGVLWGLGGLLVLGAAFVARILTRPPSGRGPVR